jgi:hypothetical protein
LLDLLGRSVTLVASAALNDPDNDPLALAQLAGGNLQVVARQLDPTAPAASSVVAATWSAWACNASTCAQTTSTRTYLALTPVLNAAGWYQPTPTMPVSLSSPGGWSRWTNTTGLVANKTRFGDELALLYPQAAIASSVAADQLTWLWDGAQFNA